jgi:NADH-quinone oxidoreductase subunit J
MKILHFLFCFLLVLGSFFIIFSKNSITSILFLVLTFFNSAAVLFLFHADFLGLIFVIIYVGAVAVLFLFIIMMLNIKDSELTPPFVNFNFFFIIIVLHLSLLCFSIGLRFNVLEKIFFRNFHQNIFLDNLFNIGVLGQSIYNSYLVCFLIAGLILLIALVGSIILTLRFNTFQKSQSIFRQLSKTQNILNFIR